jgi:hypothetical protein
LENIFEEVE